MYYMVYGTWNSFCATLNFLFTKLRVLLAGTMIFELAVKNDTESTYFLLILKNIFCNFDHHSKHYKIRCFEGWDYDFWNQNEKEFQKNVFDSKYDAFWSNSSFQRIYAYKVL